MTINTTIATITEQQTKTVTELTELMNTLTSVDTHAFLINNKLPSEGFLTSANDDLYLTLRNTFEELTGVKQITGELAGVVHGTGNEMVGFFKLEGNTPELTLVTDNLLTAYKVNRETGYNTVIIGNSSELSSIKTQLAPFNGDSVIVFCSEAVSESEGLCTSLGIQSVECLSILDLKLRIDEVVKKARLQLPAGYSLKSDGVYFIEMGKDGVEKLTRLCSPLKVTALTRGADNKDWGRYIEMTDSNKVTHSFAMPMEKIISANFMDPLVNQGLTFKRCYKEAINHYLMESKPLQFALSVGKTGWCKEMFVFPEKVIGEKDEKVVYQTMVDNSSDYKASGTLQQWQENVSSLCIGNSRLAFGVSVSFATMMLPLFNGESGGFHFRGVSSRGKTTILTAAKSVFGNPKRLPRWSATVNGLESLAASHNHTLLCLDEFSQLAEVNPKAAGQAAYMIGNGVGKQRSKSNGAMQEASSWELLYLSAGEVSLKSVLDKVGMQVRGGQEVRFIDLPSDAGAGLGAFNTIHNSVDGNEFALAIKDNSLQYYGTAATAFLEQVTDNYQNVKVNLRGKINAFVALLDLSESDPQVRRVAQRFAQVAASGELATELGITGWGEGEADNAALICFKTWIESRGGHGSQENKVALEQVSNKLLSWGLLHLNTADQAAARNGAVWGTQDENFFYIYTDAFKNTLCDGLDVKTVEKALFDTGILIPSSTRSTIQKKIDRKNVRVYKLDKKILEFTSIEAE